MPPAGSCRSSKAPRRTGRVDRFERELFGNMTISLESIPSYAVHNLSRNPDDPYQVVTETAAWDLLNRLELWSAEDVFTLIGTACKGAGAARAKGATSAEGVAPVEGAATAEGLASI